MARRVMGETNIYSLTWTTVWLHSQTNLYHGNPVVTSLTKQTVS